MQYCILKAPRKAKEQKYLEALCEHYGIDIDKSSLNSATMKFINCFMLMTKLDISLYTRKERGRKQHYVMLRGAIPAILNRISGSDPSTPPVAYAKYMEEVPCHVCGGAKLRKEVLEYKVGGLNYDDVESMELSALYSWLEEFSDNRISLSKKELVGQLINSILRKLEALMQLDVGYLCLNRSIPTLSSGERQRVRIANQLTCSLKGLIYILDEPCKGLHYRDIAKITKATRNLIHRGNTVIAIEHNKQYIASADHIVELGPVGGPDGGYLIRQSSKPQNIAYQLSFKQVSETPAYLEVNNINFRNIHGQNARFPIGGITCITGVSGSGKSTLASVVVSCFSRKSDSAYGTVHGGKKYSASNTS